MKKTLTSFISGNDNTTVTEKLKHTDSNNNNNNTDQYVQLQTIKLPKNQRLLKYNESMILSKDGELKEKDNFQINISNFITEKCSHPRTCPLTIQNTERECISTRNDYITQITDSESIVYLNNTGPPSMVCSLEMNPSDITDPDLILGMYFHISGMLCFNMDNLRSFYESLFKISFHGVGMFLVCVFDVFHSVDLRIQFYDDEEYNISLFGNNNNNSNNNSDNNNNNTNNNNSNNSNNNNSNNINKSALDLKEEDVWEGAFVSEFIRLMALHTSGEKWSLPMQVIAKDLVDLESEVKIKYELIQTLIKYLPKCLMTGFDTTSGFYEVDYLNNNMIKAMTTFFTLESDNNDHNNNNSNSSNNSNNNNIFLSYFLNEISLLLDDHEVYLITYLNFIVKFEIHDTYFMKLINQVFNLCHESFLIKQYLQIQLNFFERDLSNNLNICYKISEKIFQIDPIQPSIYLNFIKYNHRIGNKKILFNLINENKQNSFKVDLFDSYYFFYRNFWYENFVQKNLNNMKYTLKHYELEFLRRKYGKVIKNIENIKKLSKGKSFLAFPCREHDGYLETIWNNDKIFQEMQNNYYFNLDNGVIPLEQIEEEEEVNSLIKKIYRKQLVLMENVTVRKIRKTMLEDESFATLLILNQKNFPIPIITQFLNCFKQTLQIISKTDNIIDIDPIQLSMLAFFYYFTGFHQKSFDILNFLLEKNFNINNYKLLQKVLIEDMFKKIKLGKKEIQQLIKLNILAISYESRCFNELQYSNVIFIKKILLKVVVDASYKVNESSLKSVQFEPIDKTEMLIKKTLEVMTPFINKSLMNKVISFIKQVR
ncbi:hypothetical protein HANVADRAFT_54061 [Hanseniaspora valbyensis NRRL Y-1626]|uniref:Uncharacterized protein n=1 Tax=Hanseniaspora valbyensis NRRL Y-1626 TaxID=766949 RepID=A0A1B7T900_9ASCO|nr:hypothetical protein HANVADRAFT_54061 [Hanseniaspora valbyensis NRRL Y-1626]